MKAVMYHYVRPTDEDYPNLKYLNRDDFCAQLDYFSETFGYVQQEEFLAALNGKELPTGVVLTFDDGLRDHFDFVLPELQRRGLWGIFYVSTGPYHTGELLDVHRIHQLLGRWGGESICHVLDELVKPEMMVGERVEEFRTATYPHNDDDWTKRAKRIINYYLEPSHRKSVLDCMMSEIFGNEKRLVEEVYVTPSEIQLLQDVGMIVGSHTVGHPVMSRLSETEQRAEIVDSFDFLEKVTGGLSTRTFCYPYGLRHDFNATTVRLLTEYGCEFTVAVEWRDCTAEDFATRRQALPRYDCNQFPHGSCRDFAANHVPKSVVSVDDNSMR